MKDCRDCKWNRKAWDRGFDKCKHFKTCDFSDLAREYYCGVEARYFEPKPISWLKRLFTRPAEPVSEKQPEMYSWR